jgi:hypothetical protein
VRVTLPGDARTCSDGRSFDPRVVGSSPTGPGPGAYGVDALVKCVSHRDDERPSGVTSCDMADGVGRLTQRVGAADDRRDLSGLGQFFEGDPSRQP